MSELSHNLFAYATSELSQDAFLCWLMSFASAEQHSEAGLRACAVEFLRKVIGPLKELEDTQIIVTDIKRQVGDSQSHMDVLLTVNQQYYVIVEDKTFTDVHDNQLERYWSFLMENAKVDAQKTFGMLYQTGFVHYVDTIKNNNYVVFDIYEIMSVLKNHEASIKNEIFQSYFQYYKAIVENSIQYNELSVKKWNENRVYAAYNAIRGQTKSFKGQFNEIEFGHVNNASNGFLGMWFRPKDHVLVNTATVEPYIQIQANPADDEKEGSLNIYLRIRIEENPEKLSYTDLREKIALQDGKYALTDFGYEKPQHFGYGKTMAIGQVWKENQTDIEFDDLLKTVTETLSNFNKVAEYIKARGVQESEK